MLNNFDRYSTETQADNDEFLNTDTENVTNRKSKKTVTRKLRKTPLNSEKRQMEIPGHFMRKDVCKDFYTLDIL